MDKFRELYYYTFVGNGERLSDGLTFSVVALTYLDSSSSGNIN